MMIDECDQNGHGIDIVTGCGCARKWPEYSIGGTVINNSIYATLSERLANDSESYSHLKRNDSEVVQI